MAGDELTDRLRATFLVELEEQLRELNAALIQLEQRPRDPELIRTLFRAAHTVKGSARVVNAPLIEAACHAMESVFADVRDGERTLAGPEFSLLFAIFDALGQAGRTLRRGGAGDEGQGGEEATAALRELLPRLNELAGARPRGAASSIAGLPPAAPPARSAPAGRRPTAGEPRSAPPPAPADRAVQSGRAATGPGASPPAAARPAGDAPAAQPRRTPDPLPAGQAGDGTAAASSDAPKGEAKPAESADELVRVRADRLDELMAAVGELLIASGRIAERSEPGDAAALRLERAADDVAAVARHLRLRPFADACEALPRAVRDVAADAGKQVALELSGESVEADRLVVDALREPLLHLVRNAIDHGIEPPAERARRGKPPAGTVAVSAELSGSRLIVTVADDGAGIDEAAVRRVFAERGRTLPTGRAALEDAVLRGGFSTRREASRISGRGVGVDLVRSAIERIGGTVNVEWQTGAGTTFRLECPPTPATIRALLVRLGPYLFALPTANVEGVRRLSVDALRDVEGAKVLPTRRGPVTVHSLAALLGPPLDPRPVEGMAPLVVITSGARRGGLLIDEAVAEDEIVVRPLDAGDGLVPHAGGAAVLPSGQLALVLNAASLLSAALRLGTTIAPAFAERRDQPAQRILVADDSITTRTLEQSVLEAAGYSVRTAVDGEDAWQQLERDGADLVVADIEMPRMDGFALCRRIRGSARFAQLPVVLVTGLSSDEDRARGLEAGADAYIVKSSFDQAGLLDTVRQLTGGA